MNRKKQESRARLDDEHPTQPHVSWGMHKSNTLSHTHTNTAVKKANKQQFVKLLTKLLFLDSLLTMVPLSMDVGTGGAAGALTAASAADGGNDSIALAGVCGRFS